MAAGAPRRILVTGAEGFVGKHLVPALRGAFPQATLHVARFDVTDEDAVRAGVRTAAPEACVHLAAVSAIAAARNDPRLAWKVNLAGTLTLQRVLAEEAPGSTLLFVSTADAYGRSFALGEPLDESAALNPVNVYGATKAAADLALGAMSDGDLRILRVRPFNHTGPGQTTAFVVAAFAQQIARVVAGRQPSVLHVGALDPTRDFLDVRDVCACYAMCLAQADQIPSGTIFNVASGHPLRVGDVLAEMLDLAGIKVQIEVDPSRLRRTDIPVVAGNSHLIRTTVGWSPKIPWRQTLSDILADWQTRIRTESA